MNNGCCMPLTFILQLQEEGKENEGGKRLRKGALQSLAHRRACREDQLHDTAALLLHYAGACTTRAIPHITHFALAVHVIDLYRRRAVHTCVYLVTDNPTGLTRFEETKKLIKVSQVNAAVGVRGQNKVSMLAKDLARQFSGDADNQVSATRSLSDIACRGS